MAAVTGQGTTYNLPNYHGQLYQVTPTETPFLSAIGGLTGGRRTKSVEFEWQTMDRRSSTAGNTALEGAAAPTGTARSRANVSNIVEIHQSAVEVSYTRQAATSQYNGINIGQDDNPVTDELTTQIMAELEAMAVDVEMSFLSGVYNKPTDNTTKRATRGILSAITTNVNANGGTARAISKDIIDATLATMFGNGARLTQDTTVLMCGPGQRVAVSNAYATPTLNQPTQSRTVGGVAVDTLVTDFGTFGLMTDRWMPAGQIAVLDLSVCAPVWLEIPGSGLLFAEPIAKTGASQKWQLYGEVGLEYGPENYHGLIKDLT
ncbi:SU10 major capsid protein [Actinacidiphila sp. bgisy145]|uniref:SU10 major capsid protein n=1 Tax=Actinacidiphila sp. bgisy145 TaxID=3413792 RepID=UPI003EB9678B